MAISTKKMSKYEALNAMHKAGHTNVTIDMVEKVKNKYGFDVYVAVVGDAMVVCHTMCSSRTTDGVQFICF